VVQVVILAEDTEIREKISQHDIHVQTIAEVAPIEVQPAKVLSHLYTYLGTTQQNRELFKNILLKYNLDITCFISHFQDATKNWDCLDVSQEM